MKKLILGVMVLLASMILIACDQTPEEATVSLITITSQATKDEYELNDELDLTGLAVKAVLSNGVEQDVDVEDLVVTGFDSSTPGKKTVTLTYEGQSTTFNVWVFDTTQPAVLLEIEVVSKPDQLIYAIGQSFNEEGLLVEAVYSNGEREEVSFGDLTVLGFNSSAVTQTGTVILSFEGKNASISYKVHTVIGQGFDADSILVGNTAATSGAFAAVGVPFNEGIKAYFKKINDAGGVGGRTLEFVTYDDSFDAATGITLTKKLVEEDKVFALVGHFGTPTVGATLNYIQETGVPMVYAATGINNLYFEPETGLGNPVMAVQPIYKTDGRIMTARVLNESLFGANKNQKLGATDKVGVLYTLDDAGQSIKAGVEVQAATEGVSSNFIYKSIPLNAGVVDTSALNSAVLELVQANVKAVIIAANQAPFTSSIEILKDNGNTAPVFTSYVSANITAVNEAIDYGFDIYANAWLDITDPNGLMGFSQAYWDFYADMTANEQGAYAANSYAMAGYIAASVFVQGLQLVEELELELNWENFTKAMESEALDIPMGGTVDFTGGKRWGIASMALLHYEKVEGVENFVKVRDIEDIAVIQNK